MEVESRKRPYGGVDDRVQTKKRVLSSANGSPHVNGAEAEEPMETDNLELFRKDAIFRRMKHYSRENERSQARIAELEQSTLTCEAGRAALSACWTQLLDAIRLLARAKDLPPVDIKTKELFDMTAYISPDATPALEKALKLNMDATRQLVTRFLQLGGSNHPVSRDDLYAKAQLAQTQCASIESQINLIRTQLRDVTAQKESFHAALMASESRVDRLQSKIVQAMQSPAVTSKEEVNQQESDASQRKSPSSPATPPVNDSFQEFRALEELQDTVKSRNAEIIELERENVELRDQKNHLTVELKSASHAVIAENPHHKILLDYTSRLDYAVKENAEEVKRLRGELDQLQSTRKEFEDEIIASNGQACQELKSLLAKKDTENIRLRDQRDHQAAELVERKNKDNVKMTSLQELKTLAESRSERMLVLVSEITRLKAQLAAQAGEEDLMNFILGEQTEGASYVKDLQAKLQTAQTRILSLERSLSALEGRHPDAVQYVKSEAEARQQLEEAKRELSAYQSVFGNPSVLAPDVRTLSEQLRQKEGEIQRLRLLDAQRAQAETSLYAEIDKLSAAWEALDRQVNSKVFDLIAMEDRLTKSGLEKAKTENRYFAAMRDKEGIENERKSLSRNLEKQAKAVERLVDSEKNLMAQVGDLEKEIVQWRKKSEAYEAKAEALERENVEKTHLKTAEEQRAEGYRANMEEQERYLEKKRVEWRKTEENLTRSIREAERQAAKVKSVNTGTTTQKEAELEHETTRLMSLLKCSTCKMRMRNTVINKCMHTFCKECVEMRLSLRNRKCPYCNLAFAQSDVQSLFFQ